MESRVCNYCGKTITVIGDGVTRGDIARASSEHLLSSCRRINFRQEDLNPEKNALKAIKKAKGRKRK